jgi:putative ABC transport system permease protein
MRKLPFEYAVRNLGRTPSRLFMSVGGSALVVLLVIASSGFVSGMQTALRTSGSPNNVILLGAGSAESVERSEIPMRTAAIAAASIPGIKTKAGVEAVSPEIYLAMPIGQAKLDQTETSARDLAVVRGITAGAFLVHDDVRIAVGRMPRSGMNEIAIGRLAAEVLGFSPPESVLGEEFLFDDIPFTTVAILEAEGAVAEGEIWMPLTDLQIVAQRDSLSSVVLSLTSENIAAVEAFAIRRLDLEVIAQRETEYYATLSSFYQPIRVMVLVTALLVAAGGVIGGLNTVYAAFASRVREIGTLQTLGYSRLAIVRSLIEESVLASSIGALIAAGIAMTLVDGVVVRFSMGVFGIAITPTVLAIGLGSGIGLGIIGAIVPAIRCLRLPIPEALRSA